LLHFISSLISPYLWFTFSTNLHIFISNLDFCFELLNSYQTPTKNSEVLTANSTNTNQAYSKQPVYSLKFFYKE
jgi:hypothetical protein